MTYLVALEVDPSVARPGWIAFVVILLLAIALVFLFFSMRRQFRKINVGDSQETSQPDQQRPQAATRTTPPDAERRFKGLRGQNSACPSRTA